jgi:hypothetical protein
VLPTESSSFNRSRRASPMSASDMPARNISIVSSSQRSLTVRLPR